MIRVRALSEELQWTSWSEPLTIEAGLLQPEDWVCSLIHPRPIEDDTSPHRPVLFRRAFDLGQRPVQARLYITAHGIYEASINGTRIGDHVLAPGWTSYDHEVAYQTFDVLHQLEVGLNTIGVEVAEGWFSGRLGFLGGRRNIWGSSLGLIAQLCITYEDGTTNAIVTDQNWKWNHGPLIKAEIYDGEEFDAREDLPGWCTSSFNDDKWEHATLGTINRSILRAPDGPPVRRIETIAAQKIWESPSKKLIIDFGQNLVGWLRCKLCGPEGHKIQFTHTEVLENGECATIPLRDAKCTDSVILSRQAITYEPRFTFHGFRYVQIDGWPYSHDKIDLTDFNAVVIHTDMNRTGWFECSEPMLNKLHQNVLWSMRGNFVSVPTDCPQRDERLGWTGDLQAFAPTASFLYEPYGILKTWLHGLAKEQKAEGKGIPPLFSKTSRASQPLSGEMQLLACLGTCINPQGILQYSQIIMKP